jgi:hypothetical protein
MQKEYLTEQPTKRSIANTFYCQLTEQEREFPMIPPLKRELKRCREGLKERNLNPKSEIRNTKYEIQKRRI